jgi:hypothetical protein
LFKTWKPEGQLQPIRIGLPQGPRDSLCVQTIGHSIKLANIEDF